MTQNKYPTKEELEKVFVFKDNKLYRIAKVFCKGVKKGGLL